MASETPLITIGITCYNAQDTIGRAIESALAQDWRNTEIFVVDDCSNDGSVDVVQRFDGVKLIQHKENKGPGAARQSLLEAAQGDFLAFFDDDDQSAPGRVRVQYERIAAYEQKTGADLIACYASGERIYPNDYRVSLDTIGREPQEPHGSVLADRILFFGQFPKDWCYGATPSCVLMARVNTFRAVGGFDPAFRRVEDLDFAVRLALAGGHFIGCPERLIVQHATQGSDKSYDKNLEAELQLAEKHCAYLETQNRYRYATLWPRLRHAHFQKNYGQFFMIFIKLLLLYPVPVLQHFFATGPQRLFHERKMRQGKA